jgi:hypothetical protein
MRAEADGLAALCCLFDVIPLRPLPNARRDLPSVSRGERLCLAFEMYRDFMRSSNITLEHVVLLVTTVAQGDELRLENCESCGAIVVADRHGDTRHGCSLCFRGSYSFSAKKRGGVVIGFRQKRATINKSCPEARASTERKEF